MLQFFRKYQKFLLSFIVVLLLFSFVFSSVYSSFASHRGEKQVVVATTWDGKQIEKKELEQFVHFLTTEKEGGRTGEINIWNDDVFVQDLCKTGILSKLFLRKKEEYTAAYRPIFEAIKRFRSYEHPSAPYLSAKMIWGSFAPNILSYLEKMPDTFNEEAFSLLLKLYQEERKFPSSMLKRMLSYYEKQAGVVGDVHLPVRNLSLFGFTSARDWFPKELLEEASLYLMNVSSFAKAQGNTFSEPSVRLALYERAKKYLDSKDMSFEKLFSRQMQILGLQKAELFAIVSQLSLARNYLSSLKKSVLLSPMLVETVGKDELLSLKVKEYRMAPQFQFSSFLDYAYYSLYKMIVSSDATREIQHYTSAEELETIYPDFVYKNYEIDVTYISSEECASYLPLKSIWDWQLEDAPFQAILQEFPQVPGKVAVTKKERRKVLTSLGRNLQKQVNLFAKKEMVKDCPALLKEKIRKKKPTTISLKVFTSGKISGLEMENAKRLASLLEKAPVKEQENLTDEEKKAREDLLLFTPDEEGFFQIEVLEKGGKKQVLTFLDAKELGLPQKLFDQRAEEMESVLVETHPEIFGEKAAPIEKKEAIAKLLFPCENLPHYFSSYVEKVKEEEKRALYENTANRQLCLEEIEKTVSKTPKTTNLFSLEEGATSSIDLSSFPMFHKVLHRTNSPSAESKEFLHMQEKLQEEALQKASEALLEKFLEKQLLDVKKAS